MKKLLILGLVAGTSAAALTGCNSESKTTYHVGVIGDTHAKDEDGNFKPNGINTLTAENKAKEGFDVTVTSKQTSYFDKNGGYVALITVKDKKIVDVTIDILYTESTDGFTVNYVSRAHHGLDVNSNGAKASSLEGYGLSSWVEIKEDQLDENGEVVLDEDGNPVQVGTGEYKVTTNTKFGWLDGANKIAESFVGLTTEVAKKAEYVAVSGGAAGDQIKSGDTVIFERKENGIDTGTTGSQSKAFTSTNMLGVAQAISRAFA